MTQFEFFHPDFSRWFEGKAYPTASGLSIFIADITARKQKEDERRENEERLRITWEKAPIGIVEVDLEGRIKRANSCYCQITGYSEEDLLSRRFGDITHPDDVKKGQELFARLSTGDLPHFRLEKRYIHKDGHIVWVELAASLCREPDGAPKFSIAIVEDITARKLEEKEKEDLLRNVSEERAKFETLLHHMPGGVVLAEAPSGKLVFCNKQFEQILGEPMIPAEDIKGYSKYHGRHPDGRPVQPEEWPLARSISTGEIIKNEECNFLRVDGEWITLLIGSAPIYRSDGMRLAAIATFFDVTEREQIRHRMQENQERLRITCDNAPVGISRDRHQRAIHVGESKMV